MTGHENAADSNVAMLRSWVLPPAVVQQHLAAAARDGRHRGSLFGVLLAGKIYAVDFDVLLDVDGPHMEFFMTDTVDGPAVAVYTSRTRVGDSRAAHGAESMPFAYLLCALPPQTRILIDPDNEALVIEPDEVDQLRANLAPIRH